MEKMILRRPERVLNVRKKLEKALNVKIKGDTDEIEIEGEGMDEYTAAIVLDAIDLGFAPRVALLLRDPEYIIEKINIKNYVRYSRVSTVKGRLIGREGKAKNQLANLTDCDIVIFDNVVVIIGLTEDVDIASKAVRSLIKGSPHTSVYQYLEKFRKIRKEKELLGIQDKL